MLWFVLLLVLLLILLLSVVGLSLLMIRGQLQVERERADKFLKLYNDKVQSELEDRFAVRQLLDKTIGLLGTKDPIAFQQIQAMNPQVGNLSTAIVDDIDPSDNGEFLREVMRGQYDYSSDGAVTPEEVAAILTDLGAEVPDDLEKLIGN